MGAASFYKSYHAKKRITLDEIKTVATSLGAKTVAKKSLELASEFKVQPHLITDEQAVNATRIFSEEYNFTVEAACGAALSVPFFYPDLISKNEHVLVVVCGGVNPK